MIALRTTLCGGEDCSDMALFGKAREPTMPQLTLKQDIPSHDTFSRMFRLLDGFLPRVPDPRPKTY